MQVVSQHFSGVNRERAGQGNGVFSSVFSSALSSPLLKERWRFPPIHPEFLLSLAQTTAQTCWL